jgi:hypothetical protein
MRADGLTSRDVEAVICNTRQRRTMRQDHAAEPKRLHPAI